MIASSRSLAKAAIRGSIRDLIRWVAAQHRLRRLIVQVLARFPALDTKLRAFARRVQQGSFGGVGARLHNEVPLPLRKMPVSARKVFADLQQQMQQIAPASQHSDRQRLRLAYISPLPPQHSGIADYSALLLPYLAHYYDIDVVVDQSEVDDAWIGAHCGIRSPEWFDAHADEYDRIIYHFGNSSFHQYMFGLLERHPGTIVLHDFFVGAPLDSLEQSKEVRGIFSANLYHAHGYAGLLEQQNAGRESAAWKYPCNKALIDQANGIIVHSEYARRLAGAYYGEEPGADWQTIPLLRELPAPVDRRSVRHQLGIADDDFLVCSFGMLGPTKMNEHLLSAWLATPLARDAHCHLVFVGENHPSEYGEQLTAAINDSACHGRIRITGFTAASDYRAYLAAADGAVQLRSRSRGETSAAILDCLAHGIPTIVNANGSTAELSDSILLKLADNFSKADLVQALQRLHDDAALRNRISKEAIEHVRKKHDPAHIASLYRDSIERFATSGRIARYRHAIATAASSIGPQADPQELARRAIDIAASLQTKAQRQVFIDVSAMVRLDLKTGIQRVVRSIISALINQPDTVDRIEPVYDAGGYYVYAREFTCRQLGVPQLEIEDAPIELCEGDLFIGLDLYVHGVVQNRPLLADMRKRGVGVYFVVYDLLPILQPHAFPEGTPFYFAQWLETIAIMADGLVCISRAVADELIEWIDLAQPKRDDALRVGYFHLGSDIVASLPSRGLAHYAEKVLQRVRACPTILMVGTVEPRKGHTQALAAFDLLWQQGVEVNLVIVGKNGWMVDELAAKLKNHPQKNKHLYWLQDASDEMLMKLYDNASALLAASEGEGFGLPLIEAAQHKLPLIARNLPVFQEVAGEHAFYFGGNSAQALADAVRDWLTLYHEGHVPSSSNMPWLTWDQSAQQLLHVIEDGAWYRTLPDASVRT